ncbi:MAG: prolyl oligopeptidase family serine peptidase [Saprospiraceae bacterium]|nr:prolyl oligopeptidase family serine peptidase [Saprospiraceae bacterium]
MMPFRNLLLLCLITTEILQAQSPLMLDQIMKGDAFVGHLPEAPYWSANGQTLYYTWNPDQDILSSLYATDRKGNVRKLSLGERKLTPSASIIWNSTFDQGVYELQGDLFLYSTSGNKTTRLTSTVTKEFNPLFSSDSEALIYESEGNLYKRSLKSGVLYQLSDFRKGTAKKDTKLNDQDKFLTKDQMKHSAILVDRKARETASKALRDSLRLPDLPKPIYIGDQRIVNLNSDPTGRFITYSLIADATTKATLVPEFVTESGYTASLSGRPKVGQDMDRHTFFCYDRLKDTFYTPPVDSLPDIFKKPEYMEDYHSDTIPYETHYTKPRDLLFYGPYWSVKGWALLEIKALDNKDRWLVRFDPEKNEFQTLVHQHDDAWIGGPGISGWTSVSGNCGWLSDGETIWYQSEETGYSHLYTLHVPTSTKKALTSGKFEVLDVALSKNKSTFFIRANAKSPFEQHFYHLPVKGGEMILITADKGNHEVVVSPDERWLAVRYSASNKPWELFVMENKAGSPMIQITRSTTEAFNSYPWREPQIVQVPASDGAMVPARIYLPEDGKSNGAAVIFVHGAGYLQNVHHWWSSYFREYMFHNMLCDEGYVVLDMDYRASSGYGREWRTAIYRHMGGRDLEDHIDGVRYLVDQHGVDRDRVGVYGGSYGGFITLMALFKYPGVFACGAALRSVTDWAHYNHPYTANILNTPVTDSLSYQRSSPILFAEGLRDPLLILHGMADVNVQFQDVVRLSQRLIELGKTNWEMAVYPMEDHGFREASSWTDEYRRIHQLFQTYLR